MGGGGSSSGFLSDGERRQLLAKLQMTEKNTEDAGFEGSVNEIINDLQSQFNSRDNVAIRKHLDEIKNILSEDIDDTVKLLFGGSVAKHTYVDGLSDVDALVLLNNSELANLSPDKVRDFFFNKLKGRYPKLTVKVGRLAVTIKFPEAEIQLLPAAKHKDGYKIADITGKQWSSIQPRKFSAQLTAVNQSNGDKVVPTIKLVKSINSTLPKSRQMTSYHIEALAVKIFKKYEESKTPKAMLSHFFRKAQEEVLKPLKDVTGQSVHVDAYLGKTGSVTRRLVSDSLSLISRRMQSADNARTLEAWKDILESN